MPEDDARDRSHVSDHSRTPCWCNKMATVSRPADQTGRLERLRLLVKNCERDGVDMVPVSVLADIAFTNSP